MRDTTHVKPFQGRESGPEEVELPAQVPEIHPEDKGLLRAEEEWPAAEETSTHHQRIIMNKCEIETQTKKGKVYLLSPRDWCVPDVGQRDMEITL